MAGNDTCMHFTDLTNDFDFNLDKDMMVRHCFLEFLGLLKVIEYSRGYNGIYYDVTIKKRYRNA